MLCRRKSFVITGLFVLGAAGFILGLIPEFAPVFWVLWLTGCGASILGLILAAAVPRIDDAQESPDEAPTASCQEQVTRRR